MGLDAAFGTNLSLFEDPVEGSPNKALQKSFKVTNAPKLLYHAELWSLWLLTRQIQIFYKTLLSKLNSQGTHKLIKP